MLEKQVSPESPPQILKAQEGVLGAREKIDRRCNEALEKSKQLSDQIIKLEQAQHEIVAKDPQINQWRRDEIMKIEVEIAGLDKSPEGQEKEAKLREEVAQLEEEIAGGREDRESTLLARLSIKIESLRQEVTKVLSEYVRSQHIGKELLELSERLGHLRRYEIWDPKSTPEYVGEALMVECKKCAIEFNVRTSHKWICPNCTTVSHIEVRPANEKEILQKEEDHKSPGKWLERMRALENKLDGREPKRKRYHKKDEKEQAHQEAMEDFRIFLDVKTIKEAVSQLRSKEPSSANETIRIYNENLIGRKLAPQIVAARVTAVRSSLVKREWEMIEPAIVVEIPLPTDNTPEFEIETKIICEVCRKEVKEITMARSDEGNKLFLASRYGRSDNDALVIPQSYFACRNCMFWESGPGNALREERRKEIASELIEKERLTILSASITRGILAKYSKKKVPAKSMEVMKEKPEPLPMPPMTNIEETKKARETAKKDDLKVQTAIALECYRMLVGKDETTIEGMIELGRLRNFLLRTYKDDELPKKVIGKEVVVPPPAPSQWLR
jgi:hypothetical protein